MIRRPPRSTRTGTLFPYTTLVRSVARAERSLSDKPEARADLLGMVAQLYNGLGDFNAALAVLDRQKRALVELGTTPDYLDWPAAIDRARALHRSEARPVGKARVSKCRSRWSPYHYNKTRLCTGSRDYYGMTVITFYVYT